MIVFEILIAIMPERGFVCEAREAFLYTRLIVEWLGSVLVDASFLRSLHMNQREARRHRNGLQNKMELIVKKDGMKRL